MQVMGQIASGRLGSQGVAESQVKPSKTGKALILEAVPALRFPGMPKPQGGDP